MPRLKEREYRYYAPFSTTATNKRLDSSHYVEGYAMKFERYPLYRVGGEQYYEEFSPDAFIGANMSDVIFQYNHAGKVLARQTNGTLGLEVDDKGLFVYGDLSKSTAAQEMYQEIGVGLITKMSWGFRIAEEIFDEATRTWRVLKVEKVYDVSAVSIPANDDTDISVRGLERRSYVTSQQERLGLEVQKLKLLLALEELK